ncbi:helix-turn-helix domain-containing protein [Microbulbifer hydrolyticus]|uniref:Helix-turn-helix domain-containing protein n=1 Tax=Microbulbifer hydrolyticus TaxID=48074 RepID=A0A6P1T9A6_9GAMM|nr:helix-turn-helix transcriptional regulator [Microbulbifer hydrolyticus]MBB5210974.1 transcriptional regulator with XRE-family HTH domain [Microbulbifer hydrolyticus]QHQ38213.1 helix-turn-helix domain-containing protein [Microbulbifer hydrolyticus]
MSQTQALMKTLKRELKARGVTYAEVAKRLQLSESSIKRLLSGDTLSVVRLESLCEIAGMDFSDLIRKTSEARRGITTLTEEQEREVAGDPHLLLVTVCVLNHWTIEQILQTYELSEPACTRLLARLDRLKLIELLPLNRYRLIVAKEFHWLPGGPIQKFFRKEVQPDFLDSNFAGPGEKMIFRTGMLSRAANAELMRRMDRLLEQFHELHDADTSLALDERFGSSLMVALRPWELQHFSRLRRRDMEKVFPE